ncbi:hypothetical protein EGR_09863 [Echinococcus granulosus]|uniref:Uncharacterized protein n=1 Tax=Echinococcus granulosus TaxID=6210 RepID=W6U9U2_ECHGR|nr:hypothetical protein EGR_09863 [Echinococcus granulosus]EUB55262.1 hypothetical protein EGR_09863 [Echinococcus granulosus]
MGGYNVYPPYLLNLSHGWIRLATVPQLLCLLFSTTIARAGDLDTSSMPTASIVGFAFCGLIASLLLISLFITCLMCYRMQLRYRRDKLLTTAHETHPSLAQISTRQVPSLQPIPGYGLDYPPRPPSLPFYNMQNQSYLVGSESIYPSLSDYVHQNPMTMSSHPIRRQPDYPVEPRIERQNDVYAAVSLGQICPLPPQELDEMDSSSSLDNDHFLLSLESAVFTATPTSSAVTTVVAPLYSFTFQDGDLGDGGSAGSGLLGGWRDGLLYPPLPPGSPVVGFAYLGLGGIDDEEKDEEVAKDDWRRRDEVKLRNPFH